MNSGIGGVNLETDIDTGISSSMEVNPSVPATPDNMDLDSPHVDCRVCNVVKVESVLIFSVQRMFMYVTVSFGFHSYPPQPPTSQKVPVPYN